MIQSPGQNSRTQIDDLHRLNQEHEVECAPSPVTRRMASSVDCENALALFIKYYSYSPCYAKF